MDIETLERELRELRKEESVLSAGLGPGLSPPDRARLWVVHDEVLRVERALAAARGGTHPVAWPLPENWTLAIESTPLLITTGLDTLLLFEALRGRPEPRRIGVLTFEHCVGSKLGHPNDEVIHGHPLFGKGIEVGGSYIVERSAWHEEIRTLNSVHSQFSLEYWRSIKHYLLFFKERTLEFLARSVSSQLLEGSMREVSTQVLNSRVRFD